MPDPYAVLALAAIVVAAALVVMFLVNRTAGSHYGRLFLVGCGVVLVAFLLFKFAL